MFNIGDKVVYIKKNNNILDILSNLKIGKSYTIDHIFYDIYDNRLSVEECNYTYPDDWFISLCKLRQEKLKKLYNVQKR